MQSRKNKSKFAFFDKLLKGLAFFDEKKVIQKTEPITSKDLLNKLIEEKTTPLNLTKTIELATTVLKSNEPSDNLLGKKLLKKTIASGIKLTAKNSYHLMLLIETLNLSTWVDSYYKGWGKKNSDFYNLNLMTKTFEELPILQDELDLILQNVYHANLQNVLEQITMQFSGFKLLLDNHMQTVMQFPAALSLIIADYLLLVYAEDKPHSKYQAYTYAQAAIQSIQSQAYENGLIQINQALNKNPNNPDYLHIRATLLERMGEDAKALTDITKAIPLASNLIHKLICPSENKALLTDLYYLKGIALLNIDKQEEAISSFISALQLAGKDRYGVRLRILSLFHTLLTGDHLQKNDIKHLQYALKPDSTLNKLLKKLVKHYPSSTILMDIQEKLDTLQSSLSMRLK